MRSGKIPREGRHGLCLLNGCIRCHGQVLASFTYREHPLIGKEGKVIRVPLCRLLMDLLSSAIVLECHSSCMVRRGRTVMQIHPHEFLKMVGQGCDRGIATSAPLCRKPAKPEINERQYIIGMSNIRHRYQFCIILLEQRLSPSVHP